MAVDKLGSIGWLFVGILASGLGLRLPIKFLQVPLGLAHKLLALFCLVLLLRIAGARHVFERSPALTVAAVVFAVAYVAAFVTGIVHSIPAYANSLWLNLHRVAAVGAAIACALAARLLMTAARP